MKFAWFQTVWAKTRLQPTKQLSLATHKATPATQQKTGPLQPRLLLAGLPRKSAFSNSELALHSQGAIGRYERSSWPYY